MRLRVKQYGNKAWPALRGIGFALTLTMLQGCETASQGQNSFCLLYKPVYTSVRDTEETRLEVDGNNAVWLELKCGK